MYLIWLCWVLVATCKIWFPDQGWNPGPLHWKLRVFANEPLRSLNFWTVFLCFIDTEYPCTGVMWIWKFLSLLWWSGLLISCCWHFSSIEPHELLASSTCPQDYRLCFLSPHFKCGDSRLSAGTSVSALQHPKFLGLLPIALEHETTQNSQSTLPSMSVLALSSSVSPWLWGFLFSYKKSFTNLNKWIYSVSFSISLCLEQKKELLSHFYSKSHCNLFYKNLEENK